MRPGRLGRAACAPAPLSPRPGARPVRLHIVCGKTANQRRLRRRTPNQNSNALHYLPDTRPSPARALEDAELLDLACRQLRERLSACNFEVLWLRLVESRTVSEIAEQLGLSHKQVRYRLHRARRKAEQIGAALANEHPAAPTAKPSSYTLNPSYLDALMYIYDNDL